jgi:hypothetical protein
MYINNLFTCFIKNRNPALILIDNRPALLMVVDLISPYTLAKVNRLRMRNDT